jgi:N-acetylglucosaminyldiphosphoundecaprenol N-acetyl-beta-D-mannosaminyltransferase
MRLSLAKNVPRQKKASSDMALTQESDMTSLGGWQQRWRSMVSKIQLVQTLAAEQELLRLICSPSQPIVVAFANAHAMNSVAESPSFFHALQSADWVLRDGSGMATLLKLLGKDPGVNLNGTDLIPKIIRLFNGRRIAFFGTQEPYLEQGLVAAREYAPQSHLSSANGFLEVDAYLSLAATQRFDLIVLGMGMPKQEFVAGGLRSQLDFPCTIVCGGAIIDFLAGRAARAPLWMRRAGVEWAYRLALEPKRLFHRYVIGNPVFLLRAFWLKISGRK